MKKFVYTDPTPGLCDNCGASLHGEYCHLCGQKDKTYIRNVFSLLHEFLQEFGSWDSRLARTFAPLLFKPGFLSMEYVAGRRARYVPPIRLYLFISLVFFLTVAMVAKVDTTQWRHSIAQAPPAEQVAEPADTTPATPRDGVGITVETSPESRRRPLSERVNVNIPFLADETNAEIQRRVVRSMENPDLFLQQARQLAPPMMFLLLPVFAFLLKILYLFAKRFYTEHLTLALHTHSFLFASFLLLMMFSGIDDWSTKQASTGWIGAVMGWLTIALWIWVPVYLFLAQKRFYNQGWFFTTLKFFLTSTVYMFMISFGAIGLIVLSALTA